MKICEGVFFFVIIARKTPYEGPVFQAECRVVTNLWPKVPPDPVLYHSPREWSPAWTKAFIDRIDTPREAAEYEEGGGHTQAKVSLPARQHFYLFGQGLFSFQV